MSKKTIVGRLLMDFRLRRAEAKRELEDSLWKRNKLANPKLHTGYEVHEQAVHTSDGGHVIELQLWKKVDTVATKIVVDVKSEQIETTEGESIEELMSDGKK